MNNNQPEHDLRDDELLTLAEVADILRVPIATLRYWRHLGTGPAGFRIGRGVRYWRSTVHRWLHDQDRKDASNDVAPTPASGARS